MQTYRIDLHNHSPLLPNDYKGHALTSAADIVRAAFAAGIDVLGVSDHYAVDFFRSVYDAATTERLTDERALLVVCGSELKLAWHGDEVHLITMFPPEAAEEAFEELMGFMELTKSERILELLQAIVIEFDPARVAQKVAELGGMTHIAHIDRYFGDYRLMDRKIVDHLVSEAPICAIEVIDKKNRELLQARTNGLHYIQSSDAHSTNEIGRRSSELEMEELSFEALRQALLAGKAS